MEHHYSRRDVLRLMGLGTATMIASSCVAAVPQPAAEGEGEAPSADVKTLVMTQPPAYMDRFQSTIDRYEDTYPDVKVELLSVAGMDHEEVYSKILSMFAAGENIDTVNAATEGTQVFAGRELAIPLDDYVQRDAAELEDFFSDVHPLLMETMFYEGNLFCLPWRWNGANMFYNVEILGEAGFGRPDPDWSKEDFYEIAKATTKEGAGGSTDVFGYAWINRLWGSWMPWIFVNAEPLGANLLTVDKAPGGEWFWDEFYADDPKAEGRGGGYRWDTPTANKDSNVEALEFMLQLLKEGITPMPEMGGGATLQGFFTNDQLAMTPAGGFWAGGLYNAGMEPGASDVQYFPQWVSQAQQIGVVGDLLIGMSELKEEAWSFIKMLTDLDFHQSIAEGNITTVVRKSLHNAEQYAETGPEHWNVFYDCLDLPGTAPIPSPPEAQEITVLYTKYTGLAMSEEMTPQEAMDAMQADMEELWERKRE